jgi:dihydroorotate dehydrogenase (NAD+) catalytic subunit
MGDLSVTVAGLRLENPTVLASGICDVSAELMLAAIDGGAAAVVTKSIGKEPRQGNKNPTVTEVECGLLNAMGLPNPGMEVFAAEITKVADAGGKVIASVFGKTPAEFAGLAKKAAEAGACAVELNLSCPHAKGYGAEIGCKPAVVRSVTAAVKRAVKVPVMPKLTPNVASVAELAKAAEKGGADAVVAINTLRGMRIDVDFGRPALANEVGGYSGRGVKPVGVRCVWEIASAVKIPVIGVGGIETGRDAAEYIMAGASAVQVGTAVRSGGLGAFRQINEELAVLMDEHGYKSVSAMVGAARRPR